jgi:transcriptional regulator with XRE-family HTH domain
MAVALPTTEVGTLLRGWRARRRLSQLDLALQAGVSQRHLSFMEIGRAKPSREMVMRLAAELDVPLRDRNAMLLAAGYAPVYPETPLGDDALLPVRHALAKILSSHEPFPAVIFDRGWDLVWSNEPARAILTAGVAPALLTPRPNAMRVSLHPDGLAPRITNLAEYASHLLTRLQRQAAFAPDSVVAELYDEVCAYPTIAEHPKSHSPPATPLVAPLRLRALDGQELSFFSTVATFGTALDITVAELSIESFFPADKRTDAALRAEFSSRGARPDVYLSGR